jgi:hypothetical protein
MRLLCIDPAWDPGTPSDELLQEQGYGGVRFVARPDVFDQVVHYINLGLHVMLVLARESGEPAQYAAWGHSSSAMAPGCTGSSATNQRAAGTRAGS